MKQPFFILLLFLFSSCSSNGQKKKPTTSNPASVNQAAKEIISNIPDKLFTGMSAGTVAPDAATIDVDYIMRIINGAVIARKGDKEAMFDLKGNFLCPWGKYKYQVETSELPYTGLILVKDPKTDRYGFINPKGELVIPAKYYQADQFDYNGWSRVETKNGNDYRKFVINTQGQEVKLLGDLGVSFQAGLYNRPLLTQKAHSNRITFTNGNNQSIGFMDNTGKVVIPPIFIATNDFSEGLAAVAIYDDFNVVKWGYIDMRGELKIPYTYTIQPGNFHGGLALVQPVGKADFDFAYIDKTGSIKLKIGDGTRRDLPAIPKERIMGNRFLEHSGFFVKDYAFWNVGDFNYLLLDKTGKFNTIQEVVKDDVLKKDKGMTLNGFDDAGMQISILQNRDKYHNENGYLDFDGNILFPPSFAKIKPDFYSPYAFAIYKRSYDIDSSDNLKGIINHQGVFVLLIKNTNTF